jgi:hypothetical protein
MLPAAAVAHVEVGGGEGDARGLEDDGGDDCQRARAEDDAHAHQDVLPWPPWRACCFFALHVLARRVCSLPTSFFCYILFLATYST